MDQLLRKYSKKTFFEISRGSDANYKEAAIRGAIIGGVSGGVGGLISKLGGGSILFNTVGDIAGGAAGGFFTQGFDLKKKNDLYNTPKSANETTEIANSTSEGIIEGAATGVGVKSVGGSALGKEFKEESPLIPPLAEEGVIVKEIENTQKS